MPDIKRKGKQNDSENLYPHCHSRYGGFFEAVKIACWPRARLAHSVAPERRQYCAIGDFFVIAGSEDSLRPFVGVLGPVIVDDLDATKAALEQAAVKIRGEIERVPTGRLLFAEHPEGITIEWLEWRSDIWQKVKAASPSV